MLFRCSAKMLSSDKIVWFLQEREASQVAFRHERAEKQRKGQLEGAHQYAPVTTSRRTSTIQLPQPTRQYSFVDLCNQRSTQPQTLPVPSEPLAASLANWRPCSMYPPSITDRPKEPSSSPRDTASYGLAHNVKWTGTHSDDPLTNYYSHTAPKGFPLRNQAGEASKAFIATRTKAQWLEQANKASMQHDGRNQLDRMLIERVAKISASAMPSTKKNNKRR